MLADDHPVALRPWIVRCKYVDRLLSTPVIVIERQNHRPVVDDIRVTINDDISLELRV